MRKVPQTPHQLHLSVGNAQRGVVGSLKHFCHKRLLRRQRKLAGFWGEKESGSRETQTTPHRNRDYNPFPLLCSLSAGNPKGKEQGKERVGESLPPAG